MIPSNVDRVPAHTADEINERISQQTEANIEYYRENRDLIPARLEELDFEWDIERSLEALASSFSLFGLAMSFMKGRRWLLLPLTVQAFFLQHAIQGWCPPLPVLRRLGFRTAYEIDRERVALREMADQPGVLALGGRAEENPGGTL